MDSPLTKIADSLSTFLQVPGEAMHNLVLMVPMSVAKGIFIAYYLVLIFWVATLPKEETVFELESLKREINLKPFAIFSLSFMILIYLYF